MSNHTTADTLTDAAQLMRAHHAEGPDAALYAKVADWLDHEADRPEHLQSALALAAAMAYLGTTE